jgi:leucyl-tRNA synthetase
MAVPSDDERDHVFALKFGLDIIPVVDKTDYPLAGMHDKVGKMIHSDFLNGMEVNEAIQTMISKIEEKGIGRRKVNYKLRDANYSRQRYWGEPFPVKYDSEGVSHPLSFDELPLVLPDLENFQPASGGQSPLARAESWVQQFEGFTLETDTMPGFAGSSWYFIRYMDAQNDRELASAEAINYWQDVDLYVGGTEHAVGHLMYSRFWHKFLYDLGCVPTIEPFKKLINQGMITAYGYYAENLKNRHSEEVLVGNVKDIENNDDYQVGSPIRLPYVIAYLDGQNRLTKESFSNYVSEIGKEYHVPSDIRKYLWVKDGEGQEYFTVNIVQEKMSKSKFNVENPDEVVDKYGADCFRMYEMFLGPIEQSKPWDTKGIDGVNRFLRKYWALFFKEGQWAVNDEEPNQEEYRILHTTIKKVTDDIERFSFNTCVSAFMMCVNELKRLECTKKAILEPLNILLAPFAPFITEELWEMMGHPDSVHKAVYPVFQEKYLVSDDIEYPVCFNGKKKDMIRVPSGLSPDEVQAFVMNSENVQKLLAGKNIQKIIVVPGRMVNFVVAG